MSILRTISIFLRNTLVKQHPYFSCCASCGEIRTPLGTSRLCASLNCNFEIDVFFLIENNIIDEGVLLPIHDFYERCGWIRKIYILTSSKRAETIQYKNTCFSIVSERDFIHSADTVTDFSGFMDEKSEYFLIVSPESNVQELLSPLDLYTPNGIPLVPFDSLHENMTRLHCSSHNRASHQVFPVTWEIFSAFLSNTSQQHPQIFTINFWEELMQWAFDSANAIYCRKK